MYAVFKNRQECVRLLLEAGANPDLKDLAVLTSPFLLFVFLS
jgi:ankyrin repeat protein